VRRVQEVEKLIIYYDQRSLGLSFDTHADLMRELSRILDNIKKDKKFIDLVEGSHWIMIQSLVEIEVVVAHSNGTTSHNRGWIT